MPDYLDMYPDYDQVTVVKLRNWLNAVIAEQGEELLVDFSISFPTLVHKYYNDGTSECISIERKAK